MKKVRHHLTSIDAFRGLTIAAMILVNHAGNWNAVYPQLLHADWNGCTLADLVFPFFVFIMGFVMPFAFARRDAAGPHHLHVRVARRAAALVALGLVLNMVAAAPRIGAMRVPGVLQRIGMAYLIAALIVMHMKPPARVAMAAVLMAAHWAILTLVPFGGHAAGVMTRAVNISGYVDTHVFGRHTLTVVGDPEGLLGTLTTVASALLGAVAGEWVRVAEGDLTRVGGLVGGGALALVTGFLWSAALPLNKNLWTSSYVLVTAGLAVWVVAVLYYFIDLRGITRPMQPFVWLGVNPLALYFLSELVGHSIERPWLRLGADRLDLKDAIFWRWFEPTFARVSSAFSSLAFGVVFAVFWIAVAGVLYRRGIRVQV